MPIGKTRIYAHRGAMRTSPENTLEALRRAKQEGADGIELDVQLSADGELFIFHDDSALRVCGKDAPVAALKWRELKDLKVFGKYAIPHLDDALEDMSNWAGAELFLDLHQPSVPLAEAAARRVASSPVRERTFLLDFYKSRRLLFAAKKAAPTVRIAVMPGPPWDTKASCDMGAEAISLGWDGKLTRVLYRAACAVYDLPGEVKKSKERGVSVSGGVANDPGAVRYFVAQGVDGIWTEDLAMARRALENKP
ncbi:MAG: glycerophosphodiester phosphodiesterase family protein [Elusimicrobia bacterium]|nr:glycerophosphodiester phosphodiesterase family protein [Elusimicrobiota bacterium]